MQKGYTGNQISPNTDVRTQGIVRLCHLSEQKNKKGHPVTVPKRFANFVVAAVSVGCFGRGFDASSCSL